MEICKKKATKCKKKGDFLKFLKLFERKTGLKGGFLKRRVFYFEAKSLLF